ncbi:hypothetical protein BKA70DRAFT_1253812 [Coprinopsis sp. MPI-PUGE-AT-0042]|nr:hypothetical protein BKA70DRAFT_1253812 [Coprinopsis sp. MPI-PUGE-AT-0042]
MNVAALLQESPSDNNARRRGQAGTGGPAGSGGVVGAQPVSSNNQTPPERDWRSGSAAPRSASSPVDSRGQQLYRPASSPEMAYHQHPKPQSPSTANPIHTTNTSHSLSQRQQQQHQQHLPLHHRSRRSSAASEIAAVSKSVHASPAMGSLRPSATSGPGGSNVHHGFSGGSGDGPGFGPGFPGMAGDRGSGILRDHHQPPPPAHQQQQQQQLQGPGVVAVESRPSSAERQHLYHGHPHILGRDQDIDSGVGHRTPSIVAPELSPQLHRQPRRKTITSGTGSMAPPPLLAGPGTGTPPDEIPPTPSQKPTIAALSNPAPAHNMPFMDRDRDRQDRGDPYLPPPPIPRGRDPMREHPPVRDRERELDRERDAHLIRSAPTSSTSTPRPSGLPPPSSVASRGDPLGPPGSGRVTPIDIERERDRERDQGLRDRGRSIYGPPPPSHSAATSPTTYHNAGPSPSFFARPGSQLLREQHSTPEFTKLPERDTRAPSRDRIPADYATDEAYLARHEAYTKWEQERREATREQRERDREIRRREQERDVLSPNQKFIGTSRPLSDLEARDVRDIRDLRGDPRDIRDPYGPSPRDRDRERDYRGPPPPHSLGPPQSSSAAHPPMSRSHIPSGPHMSHSSSMPPGPPSSSADRDMRDREMIMRERERVEQREHMIRQEREREQHERRKFEYREREREMQERELAEQEKKERERANERAREREFWEKREKERKMKEQEARERELTEKVNREREAREREIKERERRHMEMERRDRAGDVEMRDQARASMVGPGVPPMSGPLPVGGSVMSPGLPGGPVPHPPQSHHQGRFNTAFIHTNSVGNSRVSSPIPNPPGGTTSVIMPGQMATTIAGPGVPGGMIVGPGGPTSNVGGMNIIPGGMLGGGHPHLGSGDKRDSKRDLIKEGLRDNKKGSNAPTPGPNRDQHMHREKEREREREQQREMYAAAIAGGPSMPPNPNAPGQPKKGDPDQHRVHSRQPSMPQQQRRNYPYPEEIGGHGQPHHPQGQQPHGITVIGGQPPPPQGQDVDMAYAYGPHGHGPWERQQREQQQREHQMAMENGYPGHPYPPGQYGPPPPGYPGGGPHPMGGHHPHHGPPQPFPHPHHASGPGPMWDERNGVGIIGDANGHHVVPMGGAFPQQGPMHQQMAMEQAQQQQQAIDGGPLGFVGARERYDNSSDYVLRPGLQSRACVNLGTFVYPDLPFPYNFELGGGLAQITKFREENVQEKARKEKEDKEREEREKEDKVKEKAAAEEKAKELAARKDQEEGEIAPEAEKEKLLEVKNSEPSNIVISSPKTAPEPVQPLTELQALNEATSNIRPITVDVETRVTVVIPNGHVPDEKPRQLKIWGGGIFPPLNGEPQWPNHRAKNPADLQTTTSSGEPLSVDERKAAAKFRHKSELEVMQRYRARRIYTDDSDLFLCCLHSGWVTWKGAKRARRKGLDLKVEVRVLRVAGLRNASGKDNDAPIVVVKSAGSGQNSSASQTSRSEEVVVRFLGGRGERCGIMRNAKGLTEAEDIALASSEEAQAKSAAGKRRRDEDDTDDEEHDDGSEDDGRGFMSSGWGNTHDGAAIEIVNAQFVERGNSSGRRNRSQRLREYTERRVAVLGGHCPNPSGHGAITLTPYNCTPSFTTGRLAGLKRRRPLSDSHPPINSKTPNATVLDIIREVEEEEEREEDERRSKRRRLHGPSQNSLEVQKEDALMNLRTVIFSTSTQGADAGMDEIPTSPVATNPLASVDGGLKVRVGHKYTPSGLDKLLFPEAIKRQGVTSQDPIPASLYASLPRRPVLLETPKERYLFAPSILAPEPSGSSGRIYDISLIIETEVTVLEEEPAQKDDDILGDLATIPTLPSAEETSTTLEEPAIIVDPPPETVQASPTEPKHEPPKVDEFQETPGDSIAKPVETEPKDDKEEGEVSENGETEAPANATGTGDKDGDVDMGEATPDLPSEPPVLLSPPVTREHTTPRPELALAIPLPGSQTVQSRATSVSKSPQPEHHQPIIVSEAEQEEDEDAGPDDSFITLARGEDENGNEKSLHYPVQLLQRGITRDMLRFELDGVYVKDVSDKPGVELPEWRIQVINWKWAGA